MKKILLSLLIIGILGGGFAYYQFTKKVPTLENITADYILTADEIFDAFDTNETEAQKKYGNKVLEITGVILNTKTDENGLFSVVLEAQNAMIGGVNCSLAQPIKNLNVGKTVTIKGQCQGYLMSVILNNCTLIES